MTSHIRAGTYIPVEEIPYHKLIEVRDAFVWAGCDDHGIANMDIRGWKYIGLDPDGYLNMWVDDMPTKEMTRITLSDILGGKSYPSDDVFLQTLQDLIDWLEAHPTATHVEFVKKAKDALSDFQNKSD